MSKLQIEKGYLPGCIGRIAELHGVYYDQHWDFGQFFEAKVATELSEFLNRYDTQRDGLWTISSGARIEASITIDGIHADDDIGGAHLRWFIVSDVLRGQGVGNQLMDTAIQHCQENGYKKIYLWTFAGLDAAKHLYEKAGFKLGEQRTGAQWGIEVKEQRFERLLP